MEKRVLRGLPQGSILGTTLYILNMNSLSKARLGGKSSKIAVSRKKTWSGSNDTAERVQTNKIICRQIKTKILSLKNIYMIFCSGFVETVGAII